MTDKKLKANSGNLQLGDVVTVDQTNSRLGIGTPSPNRLLEVAASGVSTIAHARLTGTNSNGDLSSQVEIAAYQGTGLTDSRMALRTRSSGTLIDSVVINEAGAVTLGPTGAAISHTAFGQIFYVNNNRQGESATLELRSLNTNGTSVNLANIVSSGEGNGPQTKMAFFTRASNGTINENGSVSSAGAWTLGPSGGSVDHKINGRIHFDFSTASGTFVAGTFGRNAVRALNGTVFQGIDSGEPGEIIFIAADGSFTIQNDSASAASGRRIITGTAGTITCNAGATLIYNNGRQRWVVLGYS